MLHRQKPDPKAAMTNSQTRDNIFSKSRDTRKDRGMQVKDKYNPQALFRISALL